MRCKVYGLADMVNDANYDAHIGRLVLLYLVCPLTS